MLITQFANFRIGPGQNLKNYIRRLTNNIFNHSKPHAVFAIQAHIYT